MRSLSLVRRLFASAAFVSLAAATSTSSAQPVALDRLDPAPAGDRMFGVQSPYTAGSLTPNFMVLGDYAHRPLVLRSVTGDERLGVIVSNQMFLHLGASVALWDRLNVNVDVPIALLQDGDSPNVGGQAFASPGKAEIGDLRFGARVRLYGDVFDAFQFAIGGYVWAPTGPSGVAGAYVGDGKARGMPQLIVGGRTDRFVWSAAAGPELRAKEQVADVKLGSMLEFGGGVGVLVGEERHLQLGVETSWALGLRELDKGTVNGEALADVRYRIGEYVELGAGVGPGLSSGVGTPDVRGVAMIAFAPEPKRPAPPVVAEPPPPPPPEPAPVAAPAPKPEPPPPPPAPDRDGDGVPDAEDACPDVAGQPSKDPKKNGCPQTVRVTEKEIAILEQVQFDTGRATIKPASDGLLDELATVFKDHAEIAKVEVQGHTDDKGLAAQNQKVSQARAEAVQVALMKRGVARERLVAKGYGQDKPLVPNDSDANRQQNRRVQFAILERKSP